MCHYITSHVCRKKQKEQKKNVICEMKKKKTKKKDCARSHLSELLRYTAFRKGVPSPSNLRSALETSFSRILKYHRYVNFEKKKKKEEWRIN